MIGINAPILAFFEPGTTPALSFGATTDVSALVGQSITLSGHLISLP
jgi:hypothetical protein